MVTDQNSRIENLVLFTMLHNSDVAIASERVLYCSKLHPAGVTAEGVR